MSRVLLVDDAKIFARLLQRSMENSLGCTVSVADTLAEAKALLADNPAGFDVALASLALPDASWAETVSLLAPLLPTIVFTEECDRQYIDTLWAKGVADCVAKGGEQNLRHTLDMVKRLINNKHIKVLVVDDSKVSRIIISRLLTIHAYQVIEALDGVHALEVMAAHPDVRMVVTDYNMPNMDGFCLTSKIRARHPKEELAIIGVSAEGNNHMSAQFIRCGANDFLRKPFVAEEFYCRINHSVEMLELIQAIRDASIRDFLTGLHNRRYLFETGATLFRKTMMNGMSLMSIVADIDFFKKVNDTYGHDAGDAVIVFVAKHLQRIFGDHGIVTRMGGEEFCVLLVGLDPANALGLAQEYRQYIEDSTVTFAEHDIRFTVSMGLCTIEQESLEATIKMADDALYAAKNGGRNQVVVLPA
ncbi:MAG: diguanylate cyclase [Desulfovibrionaceae bacterium]